MVRRSQTKHKYAICCLLSSLAGFMGIINPALSGVLVKRAKENFTVYSLLPVLVCMIAVKLIRMYLRISITKLLGGSQRAPFIWLQHKIGKWLWWLEPMLNNWGWAGMIVTRIAGERGISSQVASSVTYTLTDTGVTVLAGVIYYYTDNFIFAFLSVLILPVLTVVPWFAEKNIRIKKQYGDEFKKIVVKKGRIVPLAGSSRHKRDD